MSRPCNVHLPPSQFNVSGASRKTTPAASFQYTISESHSKRRFAGSSSVLVIRRSHDAAIVPGPARVSSSACVAPRKTSSMESPSASNATSASAMSSRNRNEYDMSNVTERDGAKRQKEKDKRQLVKFECLGEVRQIAAAVARHEDHIFNANGAKAGIVEARLDGNDMSLLQQRTRATDTRRFMDIQPDPMARPMEIPLHPSVDQTGLVAGLFEPLANAAVDFHAVCAVFDFRDGLFLRILDGLMKLLQFRARRSSDNRARHVGKIPGRGGSGEHVENNTAMRC